VVGDQVVLACGLGLRPAAAVEELDRSFIAGLGWDRSATAIVRSVIDYAQGFYFAEPCEPHQLLEMLGLQAS
jgi:EAL domain-containing protein (putative c-di-GMP-specific phosphodiesterase class I)